MKTPASGIPNVVATLRLIKRDSGGSKKSKSSATMTKPTPAWSIHKTEASKGS
jgi:hypothetical protein